MARCFIIPIYDLDKIKELRTKIKQKAIRFSKDLDLLISVVKINDVDFFNFDDSYCDWNNLKYLLFIDSSEHISEIRNFIIKRLDPLHNSYMIANEFKSYVWLKERMLKNGPENTASEKEEIEDYEKELKKYNYTYEYVKEKQDKFPTIADGDIKKLFTDEQKARFFFDVVCYDVITDKLEVVDIIYKHD